VSKQNLKCQIGKKKKKKKKIQKKKKKQHSIPEKVNNHPNMNPFVSSKTKSKGRLIAKRAVSY